MKYGAQRYICPSENVHVRTDNLHIECSFLKFWITMLIVCNNWRATIKGLEAFNIRTNSPMTCFSMKNLKNQHITYQAELKKPMFHLGYSRSLTQKRLDHAGHHKLLVLQLISVPQLQNPSSKKCYVKNFEAGYNIFFNFLLLCVFGGGGLAGFSSWRIRIKEFTLLTSLTTWTFINCSVRYLLIRKDK